MYTRTALLTIALAAAGIGFTAGPIADGAAAGREVIVLSSGSSPAYHQVLEGLRSFLSKSVADVTLVELSMEGNADSKNALEKLKSRGPALVVTLGSRSTAAFTEAGLAVPAVATLLPDAALIQGARNITGVVLEFPVERSLQWIRKIVPDARSIGILFNPNRHSDLIKQARSVAKPMNFRIVEEIVESPKDIPPALSRLSRQADILWAVPDPGIYAPETSKEILLFSFRNRIPLVGLSSSWVQAGALFALERDYVDIGAQCAEMAVKVLGGVSPDQILISPPRKMVFDLNLKAAGQLNLNLSTKIVEEARSVIQ